MINDPKIIQEILKELDNTSAEDIRKAVDEALIERIRIDMLKIRERNRF